MTKSIERLFYQVSLDRGKRSEERVRNALQILVDKGSIDFFEADCVLDRRGIDFLVSCGSKRYKISVKSSQGGVDWELRKHPDRARRRDLIFVIPSVYETNEELADRIMEEIVSFEERMHNH